MKVLPRLHVVGPMGLISNDEFVEIAKAIDSAGTCAVHVRLPGALGLEVFDVARALKGAFMRGESQVYVNDRVDVAMLVNAAGVHLGERSMPINVTKRMVGKTRLIGRSIHDRPGSAQAILDGANYLFAGHIYETESKPGEPGRGLDWLHEICRASVVPVVAIGGITVDRVGEVLDAGAYGVAVGREILLAEDPAAVATEFFATLERE